MAQHTTPTAAEAWRPNVVSTYSPEDLLGQALIIQTATLAGTVEGDEPIVTVPYVAQDAEAGFVPEGEEIPVAGGQLAEVTISTDKVAVLTTVSRELAAQPGAAERIARSLQRSVTAKADAAFLGNTGGPTGLFNLPGIPTVGTLGGDLFAAYDAVAAIESDGGTPTHLLVNPGDWGTLSKIPEGTGSARSLLANVHDAATRSLAGVPVIVHAAVPQGEALMLDKAEVVAAYGQLQLARSEDAFFEYDAVGIRATFRLGWNVVRTARLAKLTIDNGS